MEVHSLEGFNHFYAIFTVFNLTYAAYKVFSHHINDNIFGLEAKIKSIVADISIEIEGINAGLSNKIKGDINDIIIPLEDFREKINIKYYNFFKGFELIYVIGGLYAFFLIYLSAIDTNKQVLTNWLVAFGSITLIMYIVFIKRIFNSQLKRPVSRVTILIIFVIALIITHLFLLFHFNILAFALVVHLSNLLVILPIIINSIGALIFKRDLDITYQEIKKLLNLNVQEEISILVNKWKKSS